MPFHRFVAIIVLLTLMPIEPPPPAFGFVIGTPANAVDLAGAFNQKALMLREGSFRGSLSWLAARQLDRVIIAGVLPSLWLVPLRLPSWVLVLGTAAVVMLSLVVYMLRLPALGIETSRDVMNENPGSTVITISRGARMVAKILIERSTQETQVEREFRAEAQKNNLPFFTQSSDLSVRIEPPLNAGRHLPNEIDGYLELMNRSDPKELADIVGSAYVELMVKRKDSNIVEPANIQKELSQLLGIAEGCSEILLARFFSDPHQLRRRLGKGRGRIHHEVGRLMRGQARFLRAISETSEIRIKISQDHVHALLHPVIEDYWWTSWLTRNRELAGPAISAVLYDAYERSGFPKHPIQLDPSHKRIKFFTDVQPHDWKQLKLKLANDAAKKERKIAAWVFHDALLEALGTHLLALANGVSKRQMELFRSALADLERWVYMNRSDHGNPAWTVLPVNIRSQFENWLNSGDDARPTTQDLRRLLKIFHAFPQFSTKTTASA